MAESTPEGIIPIVLHSQLRGFVSHNHFVPGSGDSPSRSDTKVQREPGMTRFGKWIQRSSNEGFVELQEVVTGKEAETALGENGKGERGEGTGEGTRKWGKKVKKGEKR